MKKIVVKGARVNNLKNINLEIPLNKITCLIGPSGSGKTSFAFGTLYNESKRRFLNSLSTNVQFFSEKPTPVDVDLIYPVLPVFGLPQNNPVVGSRLNVADIMQITEMLKKYAYRFGDDFCPTHKEKFIKQDINQLVTNVYGEEDVLHFLISKEDFLNFYRNRPFPVRSIASKRHKSIQDFDPEHGYWEVLRKKSSKLGELKKELKIYLEKNVEISIFSKSTKKIKALKISNEEVCPVKGCNKKRKPLTIDAYTPHSPLGACTNCKGFGEELHFDEEKLLDFKKSINEDGVKILNYKRYQNQKSCFLSEAKKKKISFSKKIEELDEKFDELLYTGSGKFKGLDFFFRELERKKYKMNVRIFLRSIQTPVKCSECEGTRLKKELKQVHLNKKMSYWELQKLTISEIYNYFQSYDVKDRNEKRNKQEIVDALKMGMDLGLGHLRIDRKVKTLSAGEYQRLLLIKYLSFNGTNALFVFDEPSLGLNLSEQKSLLKGFKKLTKQNNTVLLVEHSKFFHTSSDEVIAFGPGGGATGGQIVDIAKDNTKTLKCSPLKRLSTKREWVDVKKPKIYDREFKSFKIPKGELTWVTGASGTGKSACLINILANEINYQAFGEYLDIKRGEFSKITGISDFENILVIDSNLNRYSSRSSVGSLTGLATLYRRYFSRLPISKSLGLQDGHFSKNSDLGACPSCEGKGKKIIEMQFLEDIELVCEDCNGGGLKSIYGAISNGSFSAKEGLNTEISEVFKTIPLTPKFQRVLDGMKQLSLDYLSLGREVKTLSGGEKQRLYLLSKLEKKLSNGIIFLENISFGLSDKDLINVLNFVQSLVADGNTVIVLDQNPLVKNFATYSLNFE